MARKRGGTRIAPGENSTDARMNDAPVKEGSLVNQPERLNAVLELVTLSGWVSVEDASKKLGVSRATIRRDSTTSPASNSFTGREAEPPRPWDTNSP